MNEEVIFPQYLKTIYKHLQNAEYAYFDLIKISPAYDPIEKQHYATEVKCFGLMIENGSLSPIMEWSSGKTTDIFQLSTEEINYLKTRASNETRPYLVARYNHILFLLSKNNSYAHIAIDAYYLLANDYLTKLQSKGYHVNGLSCLVEAYAYLTTSTKYQVDTCKTQLQKWFDETGQHLYYYESFLRLFAEIQIIKRADLNGYTEKCLSIFDKHKTDSHNESFLESCLLLAKKEGVSTKPIYRLMAETQLTLIEETGHDHSGLIKNQRLLDAAKFYKLAGDHQRSKEVLLEANQQKTTIQFDTINHKIGNADMTIIRDCTRVIVLHHLQQHQETVFYPIALDQRIVPKLGKGLLDENAFLRSVTTSHYDINLNRHRLTDFEVERQEAFHGFQFELEICITIYFRILVKEMDNQKRDILAEGLHYFEHTWFRRELQKGHQDDAELYSWMPMLKPALEVLIRANKEDSSQQLTYEEQMSFDQLAVKFEGLLRDLCDLVKINTTKIYENQTVAKDINELLQSKELIGLFQEEDIRLWQYAFTGCGYNIRNNVAHAFYRPKDYTLTLSNILILAYIKLAKYGNIINQDLRRKPEN